MPRKFVEPLSYTERNEYHHLNKFVKQGSTRDLATLQAKDLNLLAQKNRRVLDGVQHSDLQAMKMLQKVAHVEHADATLLSQALSQASNR